MKFICLMVPTSTKIVFQVRNSRRRRKMSFKARILGAILVLFLFQKYPSKKSSFLRIVDFQSHFEGKNITLFNKIKPL